MPLESITRYSINALSEELDLPFASLRDAIRREPILASCDREGVFYLIPGSIMRELRLTANVANYYRISVRKAWQLIRDGGVPDRFKELA